MGAILRCLAFGVTKAVAKYKCQIKGVVGAQALGWLVSIWNVHLQLSPMRSSLSRMNKVQISKHQWYRKENTWLINPLSLLAHISCHVSLFLTSNSFSNLHNKGMLSCSTLYILQRLLVLNANCKYSKGIFGGRGAKDSTIEVLHGMWQKEDRVAEIWRVVIKSCKHRGTNK